MEYISNIEPGSDFITRSKVDSPVAGLQVKNARAYFFDIPDLARWHVSNERYNLELVSVRCTKT